MASKVDLYLEWNGDIIITPNGSLLLANGWDLVRQRILRNLITNSAQVLPDNSTTPPDYVFHPNFGIGVGAMVGQNPNKDYQQRLISKINRAVLSDSAVDPTNPPTVKFSSPSPGTWVVNITVVLSNGQAGQISVKVT